jgi:hypothetical protein
MTKTPLVRRRHYRRAPATASNTAEWSSGYPPPNTLGNAPLTSETNVPMIPSPCWAADEEHPLTLELKLATCAKMRLNPRSPWLHR